MRHRRKGRVLGRSPSHRKAMLKNLASALFLTERDAEFDENAPKVKGRIVTTIQKAKEVQPLVEKCITLARRSLTASNAAAEFATNAERSSDAWKTWRKSDQWQQWNNAMAPAVAARRRAIQLLGDKQAVGILFRDVAPRMADRDGGYTRVLRLSTVRLGDAGEQAILEFVGENDRKKMKSQKPSFEAETEEGAEDAVAETATDEAPSEEAPSEEATTDDATTDDATAKEGDKAE